MPFSSSGDLPDPGIESVSSAFPSILSRGEPPSVGFLGVELVLNINHFTRVVKRASLVAQMVKNLPVKQETAWEDPPEKGMATPSSTLAWEIPWTEEPSGLQSMGSQRVEHD